MVGSLALNQRVWVRLLPPELCARFFDNAATTRGSVGNPADHFRLEREMLWVRVPPGPLISGELKIPWRCQPGVAATLSRWRSWVQIPSRVLCERREVRG